MRKYDIERLRRPGDIIKDGGILIGDKVAYHTYRPITGKGWYMTEDLQFRISKKNFDLRIPDWKEDVLVNGALYCNGTIRGYNKNHITSCLDKVFKLYKVPREGIHKLKRGIDVILCYNMRVVWRDDISNRAGYTGMGTRKPSKIARIMYETFIGPIPAGRHIQKIRRSDPLNVNNIRLNGEGVSKTIWGYTVYKSKWPIRHFYTESEAKKYYKGLYIK